MTVNASSSSATKPTDLIAPLSPRLAAWHRGEDLDLLGGVRLLTTTELPTLEAPRVDRTAISADLVSANLEYGHPAATALGEKLAHPDTRVVFSGQQPGIFGGPLFSLLKMVGAVLWAEALEAAGTPAVALFWVATEDQDYEEVATADFWDAKEKTARSSTLPTDPEPLKPVGSRQLGPAIEELLAELRTAYPWSPFLESLEELAAHHQPEILFGEAFCRYAVQLLQDRAPLLVDAQLPGVKKAQAPWMRKITEQRGSIAERLAAREAQITGRGYDLQVYPQPEALPLMMVQDDERRRILWKDDHYSLRGRTETSPINELLQRIDDNPAAITPNVLARPVLQDAIFGTGLQILGPGELSYFAQAAPLYAALEVPPPFVVLRPQALLLDSRQRQILEKLGLPFDLLLANDQEVDQFLADQGEGPSIETALEAVETTMDELKEGALALDPNLERPWQKTRDQMTGALERFSDRLTKAAGQRDGVTRGRLDTLRAYVAPGGVLHERVLSTAYFRGRFGPSLVPQLLERLDRTPGRVQLLTLGEDS